MPRVSAIIPVYNPGESLGRAIESVLGQTMADFECIVVDDGSPQDVGWVGGLEDERVILVRQSNRGVSVARNVGVARSSADLVAFLDQDDEWLPTKLERQLEAVAASPHSAFWCTNFDWVWPDRVLEGEPADLSYQGLLSNQMVCLSTAMVRKKDYMAVGGQDPLLRTTGDWDLFLRLSMDRPPPRMVQDRLVRYHLHGANASRDYADGASTRLAILDRHREMARHRGHMDTVKAIARGRHRTRELYGYQALDAAREAFASGNRGATVRHLVASLRLDPVIVPVSIATAIRARLTCRPQCS